MHRIPDNTKQMENKTDLKESTAKGFFWAALSNGTQQIMTMVIGIIMANILSVEDYGMVAMLTIFSTLAGNLQESGFTSALCIKKEARHEDFNSVFWFSTLVSLTLYGLLFFGAPFIARFNRSPELTLLGRIIFIGFFISSFGTAHAAYLFRNLMVREKTSSQVMASIASGITGLGTAIAGGGYWSLVVMDLTYKLTYTSLIWHFSPWRPTLHINLHPALSMFSFSSRLLLTNMLTTLNNQVLQSVLGHFYIQTQVGQYSQANKWSTMGGTLLTGMVGNVAQPVLASVNEEENRQVRIFRKMLRFTAMLSFPALFGLGLIAPEFILLTIREKWLPCVPYLQTLCVGTAFIPLNQMFANLLISKGQSNGYLISTTTFLALQLSAILMLHPYGIQPLLYTIAGLNIIWLFVWFVFARRFIHLSLRQVITDITPFLASAVIAIGSAGWTANFISAPALSLAVKVAVAAIIYAAIMQISGIDIWKECLNYAWKRCRKKKENK